MKLDFQAIDQAREALHIPLASVSNDSLMRFKCEDESPERLVFSVTDVIGEDIGGFSIDDMANRLAENPKADVDVRIHSRGGLAYDGIRGYNVLTAHPGNVRTINEGLAYSAASVMFMAGDERIAYESADFGIHRAQGGGFGTQFLNMAVAEFLDGLDSNMITLYSARSGNSEEKITALIDGDTAGSMGTMFSGGQATLDAGFATAVIRHGEQAEAKLPEMSEFPRRAAAMARMARRAHLTELVK